jgi:hypothetical protein
MFQINSRQNLENQAASARGVKGRLKPACLSGG